MADKMFAEILAEKTREPREALACKPYVLVQNPLARGWLKQRFLSHKDKGARALANWDFPFVHIFINDWLQRLAEIPATNAAAATPPAAQRDAERHPFGRGALAWRLFELLGSPLADRPEFAPLRPGITGDERRRFNLATHLAALFDDYVVHRPEMLVRWWESRNTRETAADPPLAWQPLLWNALTDEPLRDKTYLAAFLRAGDIADLRASAPAGLRRVRLFGVSRLPRVYIHFFSKLSEIVPVEFFILNPCSGDAWFDTSSLPPRDSGLLEARADPGDSDTFAPTNAFLGQQGRANREFLSELLDRTGGQTEDEDPFDDAADNAGAGSGSALRALQLAIRDNRPVSAPAAAGNAEDDAEPALRSVQLHACPNPLRELQVLRDHLLHWFTKEKLRPRDVLVQVSEMKTYAAAIEAVFGVANPAASDAIPFLVADAPASGDTAPAAFLRLLEIARGRFAAPDVFELLQRAPVRARFDITEANLPALSNWISKAGIRWGNDAAHQQRLAESTHPFTGCASWRHGLDRLLLGYALGPADEKPPGFNADAPPPSAPPSESRPPAPPAFPTPCDLVEGDASVVLGKFARFMERLGEFADQCDKPRPPAAWVALLNDAADAFLAPADDAERQGLKTLRDAIDTLAKNAAAADATAPVGGDIIADILTARLAKSARATRAERDAVLFCALRPGSSLPRPVICLLGMDDGAFPQPDNRPAYDLLRIRRRFGDPSRRLEGRMAFLEAVVSARRRLYISHTDDGESDCPGAAGGDAKLRGASILVSELRDAIGGAAALPAVRHYHAAHNPAYFSGAPCAPHFSYSKPALSLAQTFAKIELRPPPPAPHAAAAPPAEVGIEDLIQFFKNPARAFYSDSLEAGMRWTSEISGGADETFDPETLDKYRIDAALVRRALRDNGGLDALRLRLLEDGLLPHGALGEVWFNKRANEVERFLQRPFAPAGNRPLAEVLRHNEQLRRAAPPRPYRVEIAMEPTTATAAAAELKVEDCRTAKSNDSARSGDGARFILTGLLPVEGEIPVDFQYSKDRPHNRLATWLRHLAATAAGCRQPRHNVFLDDRTPAKAEDKSVPCVTVPELSPAAAPQRGTGDSSVPPVSANTEAAAARERLVPYLRLFLEGRRAPLPFARDTSAAYAGKFYFPQKKEAKTGTSTVGKPVTGRTDAPAGKGAGGKKTRAAPATSVASPAPAPSAAAAQDGTGASPVFPATAATETAAHAAALVAARAEWDKDPHGGSPPERDDTHLALAFGDAGLFRDPNHFAAVSLAVFPSDWFFAPP